ncbi:YkvA family protein [Paucibacter sp. R3-3]|uniref:YkvA family protein n=1 Tax=Roseateles agri TaxID=3098619 RepID=A0ABU5DGN9_9BURK|nr:YkvA family protein [Paucibacter sp. R3-3]MDY0744855.1 YkvA family protein [Paucibacter sp. R3-3]
MQLKTRVIDWARKLKREGIALWFAARDPRTPWLPRLLCATVVAYALSPIDLIPDFIPILGFVDDALLLPALIWLAIRLIPPALMQECRAKADAWLQAGHGKPRSRTGAAAIIALWLAALAGLTWALLPLE